MDNYQALATNPQQYDSPELDWTIDGDINSPSRLFFRNNLKKHLEDLSGKSVIDIGSGVGHLFPMLFEFGAKEVYGLEPSKRNVAASKQLYPNVEVFQGSLEDYTGDKKFDVAICMMAFEHILDIDKATIKISNMLTAEGKFYLIFGDKNFHVISRPRAEVDVQPISEDMVTTKTVRPNGTMYDIFRSSSLYVDAAQKAGFYLVEQIELVPKDTAETIYNGKPSCHLVIFKKAKP